MPSLKRIVRWPAGWLLFSAGWGLGQEPIYQTAQVNVPEEAALNGPSPQEMPLQWGPLQLRPRASAGALYDSNIQLHPSGTRQADEVFTLAPGITLGLGDLRDREGNFLALDYTATFLLFADNGRFDGVDHNLNLVGQWSAAKLTLKLEQDYQSAEGGVRDVGELANWELYTTKLNGRYAASELTTVGLDASQVISDWQQQLLSYKEWQVRGLADYQLTPKVTTGLGVGGRWRHSQDNPNMTAEQVTGRASYQVTAKTLLDGSAGVEFEQFDRGQDPDPIPIFSLSGAYQPVERTTLILEAHRQTQATINPNFIGQQETLTGFSAAVRQRFQGKLAANLGFGYEFADYGAVETGVATTRRDNYVFVRTGLDYTLNDNWSFGVFYTFRNNDSSLDRYTFAAHQVGLSVDYRF